MLALRAKFVGVFELLLLANSREEIAYAGAGPKAS
jgi:hypothetical protein